MEKLKMHSMDITKENIAKLAELFPNCVTDSQDEHGNVKKSIDFDQLRQELSDHVVEGPRERYQLNWPGKRESLLAANAPIGKALRPCRKESLNFDTTKNLFIEGDNLDALKLLQETYLNKIKLIYIDPPYNTSKEFIYNDDFAQETSTFFHQSMQVDDSGNRLVLNSESNGRFHSDWLSMLYPRLKLARNLLRDDGVMFVSIDDNELAQARKLCDEIFGEENFVADIIWQKKFSRANDAMYFSTMHDHILCFCKRSLSQESSNGWRIGLIPRGPELPDGYSNPDNDQRGPWTSVVLSAKSGSEKLRYEITTPSGRKCLPPSGRYWSTSQEKLHELIKDNRIWFGQKGDGVPRLKTFLSEVQDGLRPNTIWFHSEVGHNQEGKQETKALFEGVGVFDSPKPVRLLKQILLVGNTTQDDFVLDFFSGSSTTAHAVFEKNAEDGSNRRFILVQLPQECGPESEAWRAGYRNIAEIGKDRIRRAGRAVKERAGLLGQNLDIGFRVLKIDTSNMKDVYYQPDALNKEGLFDHVDNIKEDRTSEDLLFQVLLDWGVDLSLPIEQKEIQAKNIFFVDGNALVACFDLGITEELVKELAVYQPLRVVFKDAGFESDSVKINVEQIFKLMSPGTEVKVI